MGQTGKRSCLCFSLSKSHYFIANKLNLFSPSWVCFVCDSNLAEIELDAVHQVESHEGRAEENHVLSYASRIVFDAAQIAAQIIHACMYYWLVPSFSKSFQVLLSSFPSLYLCFGLPWPSWVAFHISLWFPYPCLAQDQLLPLGFRSKLHPASNLHHSSGMGTFFPRVLVGPHGAPVHGWCWI